MFSLEPKNKIETMYRHDASPKPNAVAHNANKILF